MASILCSQLAANVIESYDIGMIGQVFHSEGFHLRKRHYKARTKVSALKPFMCLIMAGFLCSFAT